jgi:hypothetical protein
MDGFTPGYAFPVNVAVFSLAVAGISAYVVYELSTTNGTNGTVNGTTTLTSPSQTVTPGQLTTIYYLNLFLLIIALIIFFWSLFYIYQIYSSGTSTVTTITTSDLTSQQQPCDQNIQYIPIQTPQQIPSSTVSIPPPINTASLNTSNPILTERPNQSLINDPSVITTQTTRTLQNPSQFTPTVRNVTAQF